MKKAEEGAGTEGERKGNPTDQWKSSQQEGLAARNSENPQTILGSPERQGNHMNLLQRAQGKAMRN